MTARTPLSKSCSEKSGVYDFGFAFRLKIDRENNSDDNKDKNDSY